MAAAASAPLVAQPVASAAPSNTVGELSLVSTIASVTYGWQRAQVWNDTDPTWPAEHYLPTGRDNQTGQPERLFSSPQPPGSEFILFQGPGATTNGGPTVLLVMGAGDSATREYADPNLGGAYTCGTAICPTTGLMQYLSAEGYRVFAVNFANIQGNNFEWAQTISDALQVVRNETSTSTVDLVAWSKAGIPNSVPTYLLCGGAPTIPGFYNENRGPSDGVVFIASCEDTTGIGDLAAVTLFPGYNHLMLGWEPTAEATISGWLA